ncbi:MAG: hypothetical protein JWM71_506 [Solirubrobacteraceae bacterium]|nr:hypothetical protein [Solirubrobacteraceae bacterium]
MSRPLPLIAALAATALAAAPGALGAPSQSPRLWATVNVCDTISHPDTIGIRGSMPGSSNRGEQMFMRFRVQYFRGSDRHWHNITKGADSGYVRVGSAKFKARQAGRLFLFAPPVGGSFQLRGKVNFQWRKGARVINQIALLTTAGHQSSAGSDPAGYSSDTCVIQ